MKNQSYLFFVFLLITLANLSGQTSERIQKYREDNYGNKSERKRGILDGNKVRTIFSNDGQIGCWPEFPSGEWPKGSSHSYLNGSTLLLGAEFVSPGNLQTVHSVVGSYAYDVDEGPITGEKWILEAIPGYSNPNSAMPAMNINSSSWPLSWPKALNGIDDTYNGKWWCGIDAKFYPTMLPPEGTIESFFVMDDSKDFEFARAPYSFFPVKEDLKRGGLGLRIETRILQPVQSNIEDMIFSVFDITNISDYTYQKFVIGFYIDPKENIMAERKDSVGYFLGEDLVYTFNIDSVAQSASNQSGYFGVAVFPNYYDSNLRRYVGGLSSFNAEIRSNNESNTLLLKNDEYLWNKLSQTSFTGLSTQSDVAYIMGKEMVNLHSSSYIKTANAFIWGNDYDELLLSKMNANVFWKKYILYGGGATYLGITNLSSLITKKELSGDVEIGYKVDNPPVGLAVILSVSPLGDIFNSTHYYKSSRDTVGKFLVNTKDFKDGVFYKFKLSFLGLNSYGEYMIPHTFVINNEGNVLPQLMFLSPIDSTYEYKENIRVEWVSGDADSDPFQTEIYYGNSLTSWKLLYKIDEVGKLNFNWNSLPIANSDSYYLKAVLRSFSDSVVVFSLPFIINNPHKYVDGRDYSDLFNSYGSGDFFISLINPSNFGKDEYSLKFVKLGDSVSLGYSVKNLSTNQVVIPPTFMQKNTESELFDGIRLIINNDDQEEIIPKSNKWVSGNCNYNVDVKINQSSPEKYIYSPFDYKITFYNSFVYTTPILKFPLNLKVENTTTNKPVVCELNDNNRNGVLDDGDDLVLFGYYDVESNKHVFKLSWKLTFRRDIFDIIPPKEGDVFVFAARKPFKVGDEIIFSTSNITGVENRKEELPTQLKLEQNYPNPFNPVTKIKYLVNVQSKVEIKVYNILGKEIKTLVNEVKSQGSYEVTFDASQFSSGVYFYRIQTPTFSETKKMVYLK
ncbi:MAG: T9SS type A sorting domain-containing protein [Ignavibacteriales bacterium]|nr:T9SS type A sorting domain-containing protein [Ignavibacteriales bacterium]